jgi:uncharacterized protein (TIGR02145 family)
MVENLKVTQYDTESPRSGESIAVATSDQAVNINKPYYIDLRDFEESPYTDNLTAEMRKSMGLLYNWSAAAGTEQNEAGIAAGGQGICPNGWSLPNTKDMDSLLYYLGGNESAGKKLKSGYGWYLAGSGTNESNMNCLPAGLAVGNIITDFVGRQTMFWSATNQYGDNTRAEVLRLSYDQDEAVKMNINKFQASSVRCVMHINLEDYSDSKSILYWE